MEVNCVPFPQRSESGSSCLWVPRVTRQQGVGVWAVVMGKVGDDTCLGQSSGPGLGEEQPLGLSAGLFFQLVLGTVDKGPSFSCCLEEMICSEVGFCLSAFS